MRDECEHGSLRRSCQICDRDEDIADLKKALRRATDLATAWAAHYQYMHELPEFHPVHAAIIGRCKSLLQEES